MTAVGVLPPLAFDHHNGRSADAAKEDDAMRIRLTLILLALLVAAPAFAQVTIGGGVSATAHGKSSQSTWGATYIPVSGDTFSLSGTCTSSGDSAAPVLRWEVTGCPSCSIDSPTGTSATLSGLSSLAAGKYVTVVMKCSAGSGSSGIAPAVADIRTLLRTE